MPKYVGTAGVVQVGGNAVAETQSWEVSIERNAVQAPVMGQTHVGQNIGSDTVGGAVTCFTDFADATGQGVLKGRAAYALTLYPQGIGSGLPQYDIATCYTSDFTQTDESQEFSNIEFTFVGDAPLVESTQV